LFTTLQNAILDFFVGVVEGCDLHFSIVSSSWRACWWAEEAGRSGELSITLSRCYTLYKLQAQIQRATKSQQTIYERHMQLWTYLVGAFYYQLEQSLHAIAVSGTLPGFTSISLSRFWASSSFSLDWLQAPRCMEGLKDCQSSVATEPWASFCSHWLACR
jgi:hypothetical protein